MRRGEKNIRIVSRTWRHPLGRICRTWPLQERTGASHYASLLVSGPCGINCYWNASWARPQGATIRAGARVDLGAGAHTPGPWLGKHATSSDCITCTRGNHNRDAVGLQIVDLCRCVGPGGMSHEEGSADSDGCGDVYKKRQVEHKACVLGLGVQHLLPRVIQRQRKNIDMDMVVVGPPPHTVAHRFAWWYG